MNIFVINLKEMLYFTAPPMFRAAGGIEVVDYSSLINPVKIADNAMQPSWSWPGVFK